MLTSMQLLEKHPFARVLSYVRSVYQPIVMLDTGRTVAYEALVRGPAGSGYEEPYLLFAAAAEEGLLDELDWACRAAAMSGAMAAGIGPETPLFVNVEPSAMRSPCPPHLQGIISRAARRLRLVMEVTEREVTNDPSALISAVESVRRRNWGVAIDDVGVNPASLAFMPFLHPAVIKLDMSLVQNPNSPHTAYVVNAVRAEAERTGARILAEGIETPEHLATARSMGATLGQGWLFGRPGPIGGPSPHPDAIPTIGQAWEVHSTPFEIVSRHKEPTRVTKRLLHWTSKHLEAQALDMPEPSIVLGTFQDASHFTPRTAVRYSRLSEQNALVAILAAGLDTGPAPSVRSASFSCADPLSREWTVVVSGTHFTGALVAKEHYAPDGAPHEGDDVDRPFQMVMTYERDLVVRVARSLLFRMAPLSQ